MPTFRYSAFRSDGSAVSGSIEADSLQDARQRLKREGLYPKELAESNGCSGGRVGTFRRRRVSLPDLALMTRRLSTLLGSSVPVYEAISTLHQQEATGPLKEVLY